MENEEKKTETESVDLTDTAAMALALATERVTSAQTLLQLRQTEMNMVLNTIGTEYSEGGKYIVTGINPEKRKVERKLAVK